MSSNSGPDIALIDYGASNLRSVEKAFEAAGCRARRVSKGSDIGRPSAIVVPGQGHFGQAMEQIRSRGFEEPLRDCVLGKNIPYIGICIGFQILFDESEEAPGVRGLGWLKGKVVRFRGTLKIPHMGWNEVRPASPHPAFKAIPSPFFYFVHSYYPEPADRSSTLR